MYEQQRNGGRESSLALGQGAFYLATGVWPLVSMGTFLAVTGPKRDLWLVKTVGALLGVVGGVLLLAGARGRVTPELRLLAVGSAATLAAVDCIYVAQRRIPRVYLLDAAAEAALLVAWSAAQRTEATAARARPRRRRTHTRD